MKYFTANPRSTCAYITPTGLASSAQLRKREIHAQPKACYSFINKTVPSQNIENTHCISTLTRFLGDGTLYVSGQCMEGGRGYRGRQGSKSLPLPIASRPPFKIITSRAQLNIIHVFRTFLVSSIKKCLCYE
jgi:hypothetical protein